MSGEKNEAQTAQRSASPTTRRARVLLILSSVILALWIAGLIAMYATTVYPQRHPRSTTNSSTAPAAPV
jgi:hypothetical protein